MVRGGSGKRKPMAFWEMVHHHARHATRVPNRTIHIHCARTPSPPPDLPLGRDVRVYLAAIVLYTIVVYKSGSRVVLVVVSSVVIISRFE